MQKFQISIRLETLDLESSTRMDTRTSSARPNPTAEITCLVRIPSLNNKLSTQLARHPSDRRTPSEILESPIPSHKPSRVRLLTRDGVGQGNLHLAYANKPQAGTPTLNCKRSNGLTFLAPPCCCCCCPPLCTS